LQSWAASTKLELKVVESGEQSGGANLVVPITNGTFSVGFNLGLTEKTTRSATVEASFDLAKIDCPDLSGTKTPPVYIEGTLGLREWIERVSAALENSQTLPSSLSYTIAFSLKTNGSLTPSFNIVPASPRRFGGNLSLEGERDGQHQLTIIAAEKKPERQASKRAGRKFQTPVGPQTQQFLELKGLESTIRNLELKTD
jgi:hypothetical protein